MALVLRTRISRGRTVEVGLGLGTMVVFVAFVYVFVVLVPWLVWERPDPPSRWLSVVATAIVAVGFAPVQSRVQRWAARVSRADANSPYDVLRRFFRTVGGGYASEETAGRMAKVLADGTHAEWAQVWLSVGDRLVLAATSPPTAEIVETPPLPGERAADASGAGRRALSVRHEREVLGVLRLQQREHSALSPVEERLFRGLAAQAGLVLETVRLEAELSQRLVELSERSDELRAARERVIDAQDAERMRLERDLHDGAQQNLVALAVNLQLASAHLVDDPSRAARILDEQSAAAQRAIASLTELSRGLYPPLLAEQGLVPALRQIATPRDLPVEVTAEPFVRPAARVEEALYFSCLEAVQNAAKHAGASHLRVHICPTSPIDGVQVSVADDGTGFDAAGSTAGRGLTNMRDRIDAVGGTVTIRSSRGDGTQVDLRVPSADRALAESVS